VDQQRPGHLVAHSVQADVSAAAADQPRLRLDHVGRCIQYVFAAFAAVAIIGGLVTLLFAIEMKDRVLEDLSTLNRSGP
jgi:hypothetical protein